VPDFGILLTSASLPDLQFDTSPEGMLQRIMIQPLRRPKKIIQIFRSTGGYVDHGELFLPESVTSDKAFSGCSLVALEEDVPPNLEPPFTGISFDFDPGGHACIAAGSRKKIAIFNLSASEPPELFLQYSYGEAGLPPRDNFKIADIRPGETIEVRMNGRFGGEGRSYKEQWYRFHDAGSFTEFRPVKAGHPGIITAVPEPIKVIDLRKLMH
jgi:hypothetical protein